MERFIRDGAHLRKHMAALSKYISDTGNRAIKFKTDAGINNGIINYKLST